jgi:hypothetical protein
MEASRVMYVLIKLANGQMSPVELRDEGPLEMDSISARRLARMLQEQGLEVTESELPN